MGSRSPRFWFVALTAALITALVSVAIPARLVAAPTASWLRPVPGALARPFVAPVSRYGAGHRGADLVAAPGTPVRAANRGEVSFAGSVAGSLHVVVAHAGNLRTSYSFLASVGVRRGQPVARGDVLGTAGGGVDEHAGLFHFGLRIGDRYVDPMALFSPTDLTRLIRLIPVDEPAERGLDPPALESRSLAESLHLPRGIPGAEPEAGPGLLDTLGTALGEAAATAVRVALPIVRPVAWLGAVLDRAGIGTPTAAFLTDAGAVAGRLMDWARSRTDCSSDTDAPASGGGSGHAALAVAGINSHTDPQTGRTLALDTKQLGYREGEVRYFSYAADGGDYGPEQTTGNLRDAAAALGNQLRALQRAHPGREVDLIGHSQGGVVIAQFLADGFHAEDATLPPIGTVVTLSSPWRGAPVATAVQRVRTTATGRTVLDAADRRAEGAFPRTSAPATRQLAEGSPIVRGLRDAPLPEQIDLTTVGAADDFVVPADHSTLPGGRSTTVDPAGFNDHTAILTDPAAMTAARLAFEQRPLPCVGVVAGVRGAIEPVVVSRAEHTVGEIGRTAGRLTDTLTRGDLP